MPIYEYQCQSCHHHVELLQKSSDPVATQCPDCGKDSLKRIVSSASFQLKGGGWYVTDFRDKNKPAQAATKDSDKGSTEATSTKSDSSSGSTSKD